MNNYDQIWGLFGESFLWSKMFVDNAAPYVALVSHILNIFYRVQAMAEQLPSDSQLPFPLLEQTDSEIANV